MKCKVTYRKLNMPSALAPHSLRARIYPRPATFITPTVVVNRKQTIKLSTCLQ